MSQYVTEFFEDNGGAICAVVYHKSFGLPTKIGAEAPYFYRVV